MDNNIIKLSSVTKAFKEKIAVNNVSFEVKKGSIFGFLGTNGAGKSTTIKLLSGLLVPTSGNIEVCGVNPVTSEKKLAFKIGVVPEKLSLYEDLTVEDNLKIFSKLYGVENKRMYFLIDSVGLDSYKKYKIKKLSKGYKQRVLIARALLHSPEVLFLDEPTSGLDPNIAVEIRNLIKNIKAQGKTIFLTTHYMYEAEELCDEIAIINNGCIVAKDTTQNLKSINKNKKIIVDTISGIKEFDFADIIKLAQLDPANIKSIHSAEASLEEVFLNLTRG